MIIKLIAAIRAREIFDVRGKIFLLHRERLVKIGELAEKARCPSVTIRYYEKMGLLPNDKRSPANHRIYDERDGERLRFILHCRNHKIPLHHIKRLLDMRDGADAADGAEAISLLARHIEDLKFQRQSLEKLIASLGYILRDIRGGTADGLEVLSVLGSPCPHCPDYEEQ